MCFSSQRVSAPAKTGAGEPGIVGSQPALDRTATCQAKQKHYKQHFRSTTCMKAAGCQAVRQWSGERDRAPGPRWPLVAFPHSGLLAHRGFVKLKYARKGAGLFSSPRRLADTGGPKLPSSSTSSPAATPVQCLARCGLQPTLPSLPDDLFRSLSWKEYEQFGHSEPFAVTSPECLGTLRGYFQSRAGGAAWAGEGLHRSRNWCAAEVNVARTAALFTGGMSGQVHRV